MDFKDVAKHKTSESCWVILYGEVYDVTKFLPHHPGGANIILKLAGRDATADYDPVHPPGTLKENLEPEANLGKVDESTRPSEEKARKEDTLRVGPPPLQTLLNLEDIEHAATKVVSGRAWSYYYSGADDLISKSLNNTVYRSILLRPRIFIDCTKCDTSTTILGHKVGLPVFISPAAMARLAHPDGEHGMAQACAKFGTVQIISNNASMTPEQIVEGAPPDQVFGWQIYVQTERKKSEASLHKISKIPQIKFIVVTLDAPVPGKREHDERFENEGTDLPVRSAVMEESSSADSPKAKTKGVGAALFAGTASDLTWKTTIPWLAKHTDLPIVLKGIQTHEDAYMASLYSPQIQGIILSNHGGRAADTASPSIHTLMEIRKYCPEVLSQMDVLVDGGIKRGTDVVKALCLGAKAVGVGRAPLWGLGVGGRAGVERVFEILEAETKTCMRLLGVETVDKLGLTHINTRAVEQQVYDGPAGLEKLGMWVKAKM